MQTTPRTVLRSKVCEFVDLPTQCTYAMNLKYVDFEVAIAVTQPLFAGSNGPFHQKRLLANVSPQEQENRYIERSV